MRSVDRLPILGTWTAAALGLLVVMGTALIPQVGQAAAAGPAMTTPPSSPVSGGPIAEGSGVPTGCQPVEATPATSPLAASPAPAPATATLLGSIAGTFFIQRADGSQRRPVADATIGLFCESFLPGTNPLLPDPIALATTSDDGRFVFLGVPVGSYFLTSLLTPAVTSGAVVDVAPGLMVTVELIGCEDCPPPA